VLSQDGHPDGGTFAIGVGAAAAGAGGAGSPARDDDGPLAVAARLLALAAPLGLLGLVVLSAGVVAPALRAGGVAPPGRPGAEAEGFRRRAGAALRGAGSGWWTAWWALVGAGALGLALLPVVLLRGLREGPDGLWTLLSETRAGAAWWVQLAGLALAAAAALVLRRANGGPPATPAWAVALGAGPAAALVAISWAGHASSGGDRTANIVIDALHNGATAAWLGGLLGLTTLAIPAARALPGEDRVRLAAGVVVRFSALALTAVTLLVVTGVYRALAELPSVGEIADSGYGRALLVKLGIFAVLLVGGAYNRLVLHPRLERAALGLDLDDRGAADALRASVRAELAVAGVLLVSVAVLISLPPP
jgi:copper transport protein